MGRDEMPQEKFGKSNKKIKGFVIAGALIALAVGVSLFMLTSSSSVSKLPISNSPSSYPHDSMGMMHIHPHFTLIIDGKPAVVPAQIGIDQSLWNMHTLDSYGMTGMAPLHTHDISGSIHVESYKDQDYTLGQLLLIWGLSLDNYNVKVTVDGNYVSDYKDLALKDGQQIVMNITTK